MASKKHIIYIALAILIVSTPAFIAFLYLHNFGVNVVYYDQWRYVPLVEKLFTGKLSVGDVFEPHDLHLVALSKSVTLISAYLTHWNTKVELFVGYFLQLATAVIVFIIYWSKRAKNSNVPLGVLAFLPFTLIIFSLRQWENSLGVWAVAWFGVNCFVLLTLLLLEKTSYVRFVLGILSAIMASLSFSSGILAWVLGLFIILSGLLQVPLTNELKRRIKLQASIWSLLTLGVVLFSLNIYRRVPQQISADLSIAVTLKRFFLALSGPLAFDKGIITAGAISVVSKFDIEFMILLGLVLTAVFLVTLFALRRRESFVENRVSLAIALFGLGSTALIALSRSSLGLEQAVSSRYTTACSMFLIGLLLLLRSLSSSAARLKIPLISLITLVIFTNVYATLGEWHIGQYRRAFFVHWSDAVRNYASATDEDLKNPLNTPQEIRDYSRVLEKYQLNVFSNQQAAGEK